MQNIKSITQDIVNQLALALKNNQQELQNSIGFVRFNLQPKHVEAALWLQDHRNIAMDAHNLHDLIVNFDRCKSIAGSFDVVASVDLPAGRFTPVHLVEYFQLMRGLAKSEAQ